MESLFRLSKEMDNFIKKYKTIVIDPPWKYGTWGGPSNRGMLYFQENKWGNKGWKTKANRPLPFKTMTLEDIGLMPIDKLMDIDCDVYLWTTQKYLPAAFEILKTWKLKYCQILVWCKNPRGLGQGGLFAPTTEFSILGRRGKSPKKRRIDSTWFNWKRQIRHSQKPEEFQDLVESVSDEPRLELFSRRKRPGWDVWGDEVESDIEFSTRPGETK